MSFNQRLLKAAVLGFLALGGCSHETKSPPVGTGPLPEAVAPDLVCLEQLTTNVVVQGSGFTPMPTKTLKGGPQLVLPKVTLLQQQTLDGSDASATFVIPDDATDPKSSRVQWQSETQLSFDVFPDLALEPGLYDIQIENPDGKARSTFAGSLAAVPRPTATGIAPDILCDAEDDQMVTITGSGFLSVGGKLPTVHVDKQDLPASAVSDCSDVPGVHAAGKVQTCSSVTFTIPKGTFNPGKFNVTVTNPETAACVSTDALSLTVVPPPTLLAIVSDLICDAQDDQSLTVSGMDLLQIGMTLPTVTIGTEELPITSLDGCVEVEGPFTEGVVKSCTSGKLTLPKGALEAGDYPVIVKNPEPAGCVSEEDVSLHVAAPPSVVSLGAMGICDAEADQVVVINGKDFLQVDDKLPAVDIGGMMFAVSKAMGCTPVEGMFAEGSVQICTSISVQVPKGTFEPGDYPVIVTNPAPADCISSEAVMLHVEPPPTVTAVAPATVCTGGRKITITGTDFVATPTVSLEAAGKPTIMSAAVELNKAGTQITAQIGAGAQLGTTYDLVVTNPDGCEDVAPHKTVTVVQGPTVFFADPEVVYNGVATRVTVYATGISGAVSDISISPTGKLTPVTKLTWVNVAGHPNRGQVVIPKDQAPGEYDLTLTDATTCSTTLTKAITVTDDLSVHVQSIDPPFAWTQSETAVTIKRDTSVADGKPFVATPRAFLNPTNPTANDVAIPLESVALVDDETLTAVVPKDEPVHGYDLIVVNPDGTVGLLANAFTVEQLAPPTISTVTPSSIVAAAGQVVKVSGKNFRTSTITASCTLGATTSTPAVTSGAVTCDGQQNCTQDATIDGSTLAEGDVCLLTLTNGDKSYVTYSAVGVTNSSLNLNDPVAGTDMTVGRRALVAAAADATSAARFVYAIGGDGGKAAEKTPFKSVEFASVDTAGKMGAWLVAPFDLGGGRSFAASAKMGRYIYVMGGSDGTSALDTAQRSLVLSPREVPSLDVDDIVPNAQGLDPGYFFYKVAATFSNADADNPGGESLPSDEFIVKVPSFPGKKIQVVLKWTAPVDSLGTALPNVSGYRVYRTAAVNGASSKEVLLTTINSGATLTYTDDGSATAGTATPLPLGSTGKWADLPVMKAHRKGGAGAAAFDPTNANKFYVYVGGGLDAADAELTSYEFLPVTIAANGHQTFAASWTLGSKALTVGRWQLGAWVADNTTASLITAPSTYVYFGGGVTANMGDAGAVEAGLVATGGDLGTLIQTPTDFSGTSAGYGVCAANNQLFAFGGGNAAPSNGATSATIGRKNPPIAPPDFAPGAWNSEGLMMKQERYLLGSSVQSAFIFLVGGQTAADAASKTTELVIW